MDSAVILPPDYVPSEKEEYMKMVCHQSTLPKYVTDALKDQTKNLFYMLVSSKLKELKNTELASIQDCFKDEKEIKGFIENEYIQKAIDRVGTKINIINSTYYTKPCTTDSFPTLHTIFLTGVSNRISKEESFLIPIGIMIYNDLTNFGQTDIRSLRFSETIKSEMPAEVFAQVFAFYILLKMDISEKHRFFDNLHLFDSEKLKSDLIFVQYVLNQTPNNSKLAVRI